MWVGELLVNRIGKTELSHTYIRAEMNLTPCYVIGNVGTAVQGHREAVRRSGNR